jgi:hypothetical protein
MSVVKTKGKTMKKMILAVTILALAGASVQTAQAGDREWAVAGKVLTGLAVAAVITHAVAADPAPVCYTYSHSSPGYSYSYRPAPTVVYVQPAPQRVVVYRAPVYVAPAPVYVSPAPEVSLRIGFGGGRHHYYRHGRW